MATTAEIQTEIDATAPSVRIIRSSVDGATLDDHYVVGGQAPYAGKSKWITTTASDSASVQAAAILAALVL